VGVNSLELVASGNFDPASMSVLVKGYLSLEEGGATSPLIVC